MLLCCLPLFLFCVSISSKYPMWSGVVGAILYFLVSLLLIVDRSLIGLFWVVSGVDHQWDLILVPFGCKFCYCCRCVNLMQGRVMKAIASVRKALCFWLAEAPFVRQLGHNVNHLTQFCWPYTDLSKCSENRPRLWFVSRIDKTHRLTISRTWVHSVSLALLCGRWPRMLLRMNLSNLQSV